MATPATAPRARQGGFVDFLLLPGLAVAGIAVLATHVIHPNYAKVGALLGMPAQAVESAWKWSHRRGLPFTWVLATIMVESGGKPTAVGDAGGRSKGLMQVNTVAHASELASAGLRPEDMHNVDRGVEWGTKIMKDIYADVRAALAGRHVRTPLDVTTRLAYKGPRTVVKAIESGQEPANISWAPDAIVRWRAALTRAAKAV